MGALEDAGLAADGLGGQRLVAAGEGLDELAGLVGDHEERDEGLQPLRPLAALERVEVAGRRAGAGTPAAVAVLVACCWSLGPGAHPPRAAVQWLCGHGCDSHRWLLGF
jgi:hypothetical protein